MGSAGHCSIHRFQNILKRSRFINYLGKCKAYGYNTFNLFSFAAFVRNAFLPDKHSARQRTEVYENRARSKWELKQPNISSQNAQTSKLMKIRLAVLELVLAYKRGQSYRANFTPARNG
jgi:hypothetical protein